MNTSLDRLLGTARRVFGDVVPGAGAVDEISALLAGLSAADLEVPRRLRGLDRSEPWEELEVASEPAFHVSLFLVPGGGVLPLHDHPEMTVLLRVLAGRLRIRSYDWVERPEPVPGRIGLARQSAEREVGPADPPCVLHPGRDNLHHIGALEDSAFLDVFSPYYDETERPCTYYRDHGAAGGLRRLEVKDGEG